MHAQQRHAPSRCISNMIRPQEHSSLQVRTATEAVTQILLAATVWNIAACTPRLEIRHDAARE
jgi:hypothetical protein